MSSVNHARFTRTVLGMSILLVLVATATEHVTLKALAVLGAALFIYLFIDRKSDQRWINNQ